MSSASMRSKRVLDLVIASVALILTAPVLLVIALLIRIKIGTPVLFRQPRIGFGGTTFHLVKFRTMLDLTDDKGDPLPDADRLTPLGRRLRAWSLDELPTLVNVLRGEMSLVGPRPLLVEYRDLYSPREWRRHEVPPGIAGPVQAWGRNELSWEEKFELDVWYVDNHSLRIDVKIFVDSLLNALRGTGVNARDHVTMPRFRGSGDEPR